MASPDIATTPGDLIMTLPSYYHDVAMATPGIAMSLPEFVTTSRDINM
jgi:hypothetical protein